ncbi:[4Fe-4S] proteins maturation, partial [Dispira simplex]
MRIPKVIPRVAMGARGRLYHTRLQPTWSSLIRQPTLTHRHVKNYAQVNPRWVTTTVREMLDTSGKPMSLELSEAAGKRIADIAAKRGSPGTALRLTVESGGCYGFQYKFDITDQFTEDDAIFECEGGRLVVDDVSLSLMDGSKVDF